jgi:tetratricopeptide (TPR) repeat protein
VPAPGEFARDVAFGLVRQLFERLLASAGEELRARALAGPARLAGPLLVPGASALPVAMSGQDAPSAVRHGLYWLTVNLAERTPLLIVIDDAYWIDLASAGWLAYMARRIGELRAVIALGVRTDEPDPAWRASLEAGTPMERVELQPLSQGASAALARKLLGTAATPELCLACHEATGGNPFLLSELAKVLASKGPPARAADLAQVTPRRVSRFVLARLARLGPEAAAVAAAVSVLGEGAQLRHVAALAELGKTETALAADALVEAQILAPAPLGFVHPLVRAAVHGALLPAGRAQAHARAAALLAADRADSAAVAAHLLVAEPAGDQQVVAWLRQAGKAAVAAGAPKMAAAYLRRALAEPPDPAGRAQVLHELGSAELTGRLPAAIARLTEARDATSDPGLRAGISLELGQGLIQAGRLAEAGAVLDRAVQDLGAHPAGVLAGLELYRCALGIWHPAYASALGRRMPGLRRLARSAGPAGRSLALALAYHDVLAGVGRGQVLALAERGLDQGRLIRSGSADGMAVSFAVRTLTFLDELDRADALAEEMAADATRRGSVMSYAAACTWRAGAALARGSVRAAEAEACSALDLAREHGLGFLLPYAAAFLGEALLEQGELEAAARALEEAAPAAMGGTQPEARLLHVRARTALARGEAGAAVADLRACQAIEEALGFANPNVLPWRSTLALALSATTPQEAIATAEAELVQAHRVGLRRPPCSCAGPPAS